jgi:type II secretory pathway pseudopilin PulG
MVAVAMIGVITALAVPSMRASVQNSNTKAAAHDVAGLLNFARSKAMQTGNSHLVYFNNDPDGQLQQLDGAGVLQNVSMLVVADADENCQPDAGAQAWSLPAFDPGINFQLPAGLVQLATDTGEAVDVVTVGSGVSFTDPSGGDTDWISFGVDGIPRRFNVGVADCDPDAQAEIGLGGGVVYLAGRMPGRNFNTGRQYAIELAPLGGVKLQRYDYSVGAWRIR